MTTTPTIKLDAETKKQFRDVRAALAPAHAEFLACRTARDELREAAAANDAEGLRLRQEADPRSDETVLRLVRCERKSPLFAEHLDRAQLKKNAAHVNVGKVISPLPDLFSKVLRPQYEDALARTTATLLPTIGDERLAVEAARSSARVNHFRRLLAGPGAGIDAVPVVLEWLNALLEDRLPKELAE
jgi:hypothetical protein